MVTNCLLTEFSIILVIRTIAQLESIRLFAILLLFSKVKFKSI